MGDEQPLKVGEPRRADQRIRRACGVDFAEHTALEIEALRYALLHSFGAGHGDCKIWGEGQAPAGR